MLLRMENYHIGNTPLVEIPSVNGNRILIKLEGENFLGSIKARSAYWMVKSLPKKADGKTIVESSSGNLGLSLDFFCKQIGRDFLCLVDETIAKKKLRKLRDNKTAFQVVQPFQNMDLRSSRIRQAEKLMQSGKYFWINQYDNPSSVKAHRVTTGPEIWHQTNSEIDFCVSPVGSCGTICGLSQFFKSRSKKVAICGVEPFGSTIFGGEIAPYLNVGAGLLGKPGNLLHSDVTIDLHFTVKDDVSLYYANKLYHSYSIPVGVTSGMAFAAALEIAATTRNKTIVVIAPDGREAYEEYLIG